MTTMVTPDRIDGEAAALARLARGRDDAAWEWLITHVGQDIRRTTGRLSEDASSADDAAQEALLSIRDHAGSFAPRKDPDADARHWIARVAANAALALRRSRRRSRARDLRAPRPDHPVANPDRIEAAETGMMVRDALARLPEVQRSAIVMHVVDGLRYQDIADEFCCPEGTVKSHISRGIEHMRRTLGQRNLTANSIIMMLVQPRNEGALAQSAMGLLHAAAKPQIAAPLAGSGLSATIKMAAILCALCAIGLSMFLLRWRGPQPSPSPGLEVSSLSEVPSDGPRETFLEELDGKREELASALGGEVHIASIDSTPQFFIHGSLPGWMSKYASKDHARWSGLDLSDRWFKGSWTYDLRELDDVTRSRVVDRLQLAKAKRWPTGVQFQPVLTGDPAAMPASESDLTAAITEIAAAAGAPIREHSVTITYDLRIGLGIKNDTITLQHAAIDTWPGMYPNGGDSNHFTSGRWMFDFREVSPALRKRLISTLRLVPEATAPSSNEAQPKLDGDYLAIKAAVERAAGASCRPFAKEVRPVAKVTMACAGVEIVLWQFASTWLADLARGSENLSTRGSWGYDLHELPNDLRERVVHTIGLVEPRP